LFLTKDGWQRTAWIAAAEWGKLELLHLLWERTKVLLIPEELKTKFFLAKDGMESTAWIAAANIG
jgi:hypothetical protein